VIINPPPLSLSLSLSLSLFLSPPISISRSLLLFDSLHSSHAVRVSGLTWTTFSVSNHVRAASLADSLLMSLTTNWEAFSPVVSVYLTQPCAGSVVKNRREGGRTAVNRGRWINAIPALPLNSIFIDLDARFGCSRDLLFDFRLYIWLPPREHRQSHSRWDYFKCQRMDGFLASRLFLLNNRSIIGLFLVSRRLWSSISWSVSNFVSEWIFANVDRAIIRIQIRKRWNYVIA